MFLAPVPILLLVWVKADAVLWYHSIFVLPSIIFAGIIMPLWAKQRYGMACHRVKIIQWWVFRREGKKGTTKGGEGGSNASTSTKKYHCITRVFVRKRDMAKTRMPGRNRLPLFCFCCVFLLFFFFPQLRSYLCDQGSYNGTICSMGSLRSWIFQVRCPISLSRVLCLSCEALYLPGV